MGLKNRNVGSALACLSISLYLSKLHELREHFYFNCLELFSILAVGLRKKHIN